jgi:hypothetical protein
MTNRVGCHECRHICKETELLSAVNPFDESETIHACPKCKSVEAHYKLCEVEGCPNAASGGYPVMGDYLEVCFEHSPKEPK